MTSYKVKTPEKINTSARLTVKVPGSKSITNRALLLAALGEGKSVLNGSLFSEDALYFLGCLRRLGFSAKSDEENERVEIIGLGGNIPVKGAKIYVGSAGTAARFLCAMLAFSDGEYILESSPQMAKRPMDDLIEALRSVGCKIKCLKEEGHFPLRIKGIKNDKPFPTELTVDITKSSQFLSALMIAAGTFENDCIIRITGNHGLAYADMTAEMMKSFGVRVFKSTAKSSFGDTVIEKISYKVKGSTGKYHALDYDIEPDISAASYFYAAAAVTGTEVCVKGVSMPCLQGDIRFTEVLESMGCEIIKTPVENTVSESEESRDTEKTADEIISGIFEDEEEAKCLLAVKGPADGLKGNITVDMSAFSDQALTLAAVAPFADGPVKITGIGHIRLQECDRIKAITENLSRLGVKTELEEDDSIIIYPSEMHGAEIETFDDHRVAMAFALTGLKTPDVTILNPECCKKTFKSYFTVFDEVTDELQKPAESLE